MTHATPEKTRLAEQEALLVARDTRISELEEQVASLTKQLHLAGSRVAELEAKLGQNSTNSSKPPSSDAPGVVRRPSKPKGRKPGGQPGHEGHKRELLPVEKVDVLVELAPERCSRCQGAVCREAGAPAPWRHQVTEVPPVKPHVTEYQQHFGYCAACEVWTPAPLPAGVPAGAFGPRLLALTALMSGRYRLSKRLVQDLLSNVVGVEMSLGAVSGAEQQLSAALA